MIKRKILSIALAMICLLSVAVPTSAEENLQKGSITINFKIEDVTTKEITNLQGATFEAWKVADVKPYEHTSSIEYTLVDEFAKTNIKLNEMTASQLRESAYNLSLVAEKSDGICEINSDGKGYINNVEPGMYLIQQTKAEGTSSEYTKAEPFLVSVPMYNDGDWDYDIVVEPKSSVIKNEEDVPPTGEGPGDEPKKDEPKKDEPKEEPKTEEPKKEEPKEEEPKTEEPKKEEPKKEENKGGNVQTSDIDVMDIVSYVAILLVGVGVIILVFKNKKKNKKENK